MATLLDRITFNPGQCGGRPCIRGMRIRVSDVLDLFAAGLDAAQVLDELPDLEPDDLKACFAFARCRVDHPLLGTGRGDYTAERWQWLPDLSVDEWTELIRRESGSATDQND